MSNNWFVQAGIAKCFRRKEIAESLVSCKNIIELLRQLFIENGGTPKLKKKMKNFE